jgi:hypothetical protein
VLKGGVLLAAFDARRPTRDIDLAASALRNTEAEILAVVREIAGISLDDGIEFDSERAVAEVIREEDEYSGVRVTLDGKLSRAAVRLHVDVNVGDPIWPEPEYVSLPRLLDGVLQVRGYPLEMVLAEKVATAIARGGATFRVSLDRVAQYRKLTLAPLASLLVGYSELAPTRWIAWLRKQRLESTIPTEFSAVLDYVVEFADPIIGRQITDGGNWHPQQRQWRNDG